MLSISLHMVFTLCPVGAQGLIIMREVIKGHPFKDPGNYYYITYQGYTPQNEAQEKALPVNKSRWGQQNVLNPNKP